MSVTAMLSLAVALLGLVVYLLAAGATKATVAQAALWAWAAGLLAFLLHAERVLRLP